MGPLLKDRILLLQFLCTTGIPGPWTALVRDVESIGALLFCNASDIS